LSGKNAYQTFVDYLLSNSQNMTPQRATIVGAFLETEGHFSSEDLYHKVRKTEPGIGQATVYRTLKLLVRSGLADCFDMGEGVTLYEHAYDHPHHDHLICTRCGRKEEIVDETIERRQVELAERSGFTLSRHRMFLYGLCPACRRKGIKD
jgi:Fur family ferric uptake transcriptional regulator